MTNETFDSNPHIIADLETVANGSGWAGDRGREAVYQAIDVIHNIQAARDDAERKAWKSLAGYKFYMFGYWAAAWVKHNQLLPADYKSGNPFKALVNQAKVAI